jgi:hypothetical protein
LHIAGFRHKTEHLARAQVGLPRSYLVVLLTSQVGHV